MTNIYCKAPWVTVSCMPGGKYSPCCQWSGEYFNSPQEVIDKVGSQFLQGHVPEQCLRACPKDAPGWRQNFESYATDFQSASIQFLDFRNNNLCNMKCRSCGPRFSTAWGSEAENNQIHHYQPIDLDSIDLGQCKEIYFAGGEPLLNPQHYEILQTLIKKNLGPRLMYSTNLSVLQSKNQSVKDLWPHFPAVNVHASIDAVAKYAECVRSGTTWSDIDQNLQWLRSQPNVSIRVATVISAVNVWFLPSLFEYIDWIKPPHQFVPVLAYPDSVIGLHSIPVAYRPELIHLLSTSSYVHTPAVARAIDILAQNNYNQQNWYQFLSQQLILDQYRQEHWFDLVPVKHQIYRDTLQIGQTQYSE